MDRDIIYIACAKPDAGCRVLLQVIRKSCVQEFGKSLPMLPALPRPVLESEESLACR